MGKLRGSGLAAVGIIASVGIFAGKGSVGTEESNTKRKENRRNAGEHPVQKILACQHPRLAYFAFPLMPGRLLVAAMDWLNRW